MTRGNLEAARLRKILGILRNLDPDVRPGLHHRSAWELLVATVLSAQCTDDRVNRVTPELFRRYPTPESLAVAGEGEVREVIRTVGIFRNKARNLVALAREVAGRHEGRVPEDRASLEALPGVGRKTASVVLGQAFDVPAFAVDTHVGRVCHRLGFSASSEPREVERRVTALLAPECWTSAHLLLIRHGRRTCAARRPLCGECPVRSLCAWPGKA